jgi:hypothetical protein
MVIYSSKKDGHQSVHSLVHRWNWLGQMLEGNRLDLLESGTEANVDLERIRALVQSSDLLKSMTRQVEGIYGHKIVLNIFIVWCG